MTVIAGYLGAGKTTLINRILAEPHGLRLLVMVNDFGAINIDERILMSRDEDTIALTNGCVCCTMGADLFMAVGDVLDRQPRPDHLIVEASGVSDPARIANVASAEPDLRYAGIVTVVDGRSFDDLCQDPLIGPQVSSQVAKADLVWASKEPDEAQLARLRAFASAPVMADTTPAALLQLVATQPPSLTSHSDTGHADHVSWSCDGRFRGSIEDLRAALRARPNGAFRMKGIVQDQAAQSWRVQVVGQNVDVMRYSGEAPPGLVAIGLRSQLRTETLDQWWARFADRG